MSVRSRSDHKKALFPKKQSFLFGGSAGQLPDRREYEKLFSVCFTIYRITIDCVQSMFIL